MPSSISLLTAALTLACVSGVTGQLITVNCQPLTIQRGDPIVFPGVTSPHVHVVTGGTAFQLTEPNSAAVAAKATTCDKVLDNSNYWQPQLYHQRHDGKFEIVYMQGNAAYYLNRACNYAEGRQNCNNAPASIAPPKGLRMVVGDPSRRTLNTSDYEHRAIQHVCLTADGGPNTYELPNQQCLRMRAETFFPSCWDGVHLDSADHKSHMAFPVIGDYNTGVCPKSHPVAIFSVFFEFFYDTAAIKDFNRWVWAMGDATGYGLHGDFLNGWTDQDRLNNAMTTCNGPGGVDDPNCSLNVGPNGPGRASSQPLEVPAKVENVGLNGPLDKLPGNNPVTT
ncbi:Fc.00g055450.m01.CDS01 [Cosmosporella sp. VM-42]